ncbi:hypothetical protein GPECTOR_3g97 [Gonium pectorale]|uniref:Uncharacterized protein n=1 Tax=Gonium pectorale TaxID=33097 RepID=A0A150H0Q0_GONPE|nr:hypothetical protein GPECTOR_3g97 [Gonium pectorale]|eukprot:KXZ55448.1 hypothetical protein GPECTOR_3g97 [Gonium pectorale]
MRVGATPNGGDGAGGGNGGGELNATPRSTVDSYVPAAQTGFGPAGRRSTARELVSSGTGMRFSGRGMRSTGQGMRSTGQGMLATVSSRRALAMVSEGGVSTGRESIEAWLEDQAPAHTRTDLRVTLLERQLSLTQAMLEEAQAQIASMHANPLKASRSVPSLAAAFHRELEAVRARTSAQMDACLRRLLELANGIVGGMEELSTQVAAVDDRLQRLEDEQRFPDPIGAAPGVVAPGSGMAPGGVGAMLLDFGLLGHEAADAVRIPRLIHRRHCSSNSCMYATNGSCSRNSKTSPSGG